MSFRVAPTAQLDEPVAGVRPQAEDPTAEVLRQIVHANLGQEMNGCFGIVPIGASDNIS